MKNKNIKTKKSEHRILFLDIETAPNLATVWGIFDQNIGLNQLLESSYILCWSAKWRGTDKVLFDSVYKSGKVGVIKSIWELLNSAYIVIHYNGKRFDIPTLNKEFLLLKLPPPAPYKQIDLYQTFKKKFRFVSNKLAYITKQLGFEGKIKTDHKLWLDCMQNKKQAWKDMERYNRRDVTELELVYNRVLPWIESHPNMGLYVDESSPVCTNCGGIHIIKKGFYYTKTSIYQRFQCKCGTWLKSRVAEKSKNRKNILTQTSSE
jgi:uncharacterized protein YprB with RNaseH-like and TPR domain